MMPEKKKLYFQKRLQALLDDLSQVDDTNVEAAKIVELDQSCVGRLSRMDALQAQAMSKESGRRRKQQVENIKAALKRLANNEYGECLECGEEINPQRLEFDPATPLCIACASKADES